MSDNLHDLIQKLDPTPNYGFWCELHEAAEESGRQLNKAEARVKELEKFLEYEDTTHHNYPNWWETRVRRWKKKMENGNDE